MTEQQHPITPPPMLRRLWAQQAQQMDRHDLVAWIEHVATQAARWGADQELEACCEWVGSISGKYGPQLRLARRPKPPSLAEQALKALQHQNVIDTSFKLSFKAKERVELIRAALERLQELEDTNG